MQSLLFLSWLQPWHPPWRLLKIAGALQRPCDSSWWVHIWEECYWAVAADQQHISDIWSTPWQHASDTQSCDQRYCIGLYSSIWWDGKLTLEQRSWELKMTVTVRHYIPYFLSLQPVCLVMTDQCLSYNIHIQVTTWWRWRSTFRWVLLWALLGKAQTNTWMIILCQSNFQTTSCLHKLSRWLRTHVHP